MNIKKVKQIQTMSYNVKQVHNGKIKYNQLISTNIKYIQLQSTTDWDWSYNVAKCCNGCNMLQQIHWIDMDRSGLVRLMLDAHNVKWLMILYDFVVAVPNSHNMPQ